MTATRKPMEMFQSKSPLVSVVIPSYNHAKYIGETIDTILNQTVEDIELIIIDDGSKDDSVDIIKKKIAQFPFKRIIFLHRENQGICRTLNQGLKLASGKYFSYCGSDDFWDSQKLDRQIEAMEQPDNVAASYTDCFMVDDHGQILGRLSQQYPYRGGDIYHDIVWSKFHPCSPTTLFLKEAVLAVGGFNESHCIEDMDLWVRISRSNRVAYVNKPLAFYRFHATNTCRNISKMHAYCYDVLNECCRIDPIVRASRKELRARLFAMTASSYYQRLDLNEARRWALKSLMGNMFDRTAWRTVLFSFLGERIIKMLREFRRNRKRMAYRNSLNDLPV